MKKILFYFFVTSICFVESCSKDPLKTIAPNKSEYSNEKAIKENQNPINKLNFPSFSEDFEMGAKSYYSAKEVIFKSGVWHLNDALVDREDPKSNTIRIRNTGSISMLFNQTVSTNSTITIKHAIYGHDSPTKWQLWVSDNNGNSYKQVGSTITSSSTDFSTATFELYQTGSLRFEIRKISGGRNRVLFDDFIISTIDLEQQPDGDVQDDSNMLLGNPDSSEPNILFSENYLMDKKYYTISYNNTTHIPNWVSWHVDISSLGPIKRSDTFRADNYLPTTWYEVSDSSYAGSGFDRGHDCPSGDRTSSIEANTSTFLMTNMIPQAPRNNQQTWAKLEEYTRNLVKEGNEVFVIMGSYGKGGRGSKGYTAAINDGDNKITVPKRIWKVIVIIPNGTHDLSRINTNTRVIAIDTPNDNLLTPDWKVYRTSVDAIEDAALIDIMSNLEPSLQAVLESKIDNL